MEPLHPKLRSALKQAHPGLTDKDIDRVEELLAQRMLYDPDKDALKIAKLDQERTELIKLKIPHYMEVMQAFKTRTTESQKKMKKKINQKVSVKLKKSRK